MNEKIQMIRVEQQKKNLKIKRIHTHTVCVCYVNKLKKNDSQIGMNAKKIIIIITKSGLK